MNKKKEIIGLLICLLLASNITAAINSQIDITKEKKVLNDDDEIKDYIEITKPMKGHICIFGDCFPLIFLDVVGRGIVIDNELNVETNASETLDYVIFTLTFRESSVIKNYKINVTRYPFSCCFKNIPTRFNYIINATAYKNSTMIAWDEISPIVYIKILPYITP